MAPVIYIYGFMDGTLDYMYLLIDLRVIISLLSASANYEDFWKYSAVIDCSRWQDKDDSEVN